MLVVALFALSWWGFHSDRDWAAKFRAKYDDTALYLVQYLFFTMSLLGSFVMVTMIELVAREGFEALRLKGQQASPDLRYDVLFWGLVGWVILGAAVIWFRWRRSRKLHPAP